LVRLALMRTAAAGTTLMDESFRLGMSRGRPSDRRRWCRYTRPASVARRPPVEPVEISSCIPNRCRILLVGPLLRFVK
jgi:hypothetical protein